MSDDLPLVALILEPGSPRPLVEMGRVLAASVGIPHSDAMVRLRDGAGLIAEALREEEADALASQLAELDVRCRKVPAESWGLVSRGTQVRSLEFHEDLVLAKVRDESELVIPGDSVFGIDVYVFAPHVEGTDRETETRGRSRSGASRWAWEGVRRERKRTDPWGGGGRYARASRALAAGLIPPGEELQIGPRVHALIEKMSEEGLESAELRATVYCLEPIGPLHIRKDRFDYSCLGEKKKENSVENFLVLLEEIRARFPFARNREVVERFLETLEPTSILRSKEEQVENFHRWLAQWARIDREADEEKGTIP